jgi:nicotinamide riboside kinase
MLVVLLGAESTGKSSLATALVQHVKARGQHATQVDEYLRHWCINAQRTPRPEEQAGIAREQTARIAAAVHTASKAAPAGIVVADTSALMVAVYSDYLFKDASLYADALAQLRNADHILLMGLDVAWQADGLQRDGAHVRTPVDTLIRKALSSADLPFSTVYGLGAQRVQHAVQSIHTTQLIANNDLMTSTSPVISVNSRKTAWKWMCDKCSDPVCEHQLFSQLIGARQGLPSALPHQ